jgi:two-component system phosphate regulon response regulator OmpR
MGLRQFRDSGVMHSLADDLRVDEGATEAMRILFVHAGSEQELCRILSRGGHEVLAVPASERPSRFVGVFVPDLIVVAVGEPAEVCAAMRAAPPRAAIVAVVPNASVDDRVDALEAGADDCLGTPFNVTELFARLHAAVRFRASARRGPAKPPQSPTASP